MVASNGSQAEHRLGRLCSVLAANIFRSVFPGRITVDWHKHPFERYCPPEQLLSDVILGHTKGQAAAPLATFGFRVSLEVLCICWHLRNSRLKRWRTREWRWPVHAKLYSSSPPRCWLTLYFTEGNVPFLPLCPLPALLPEDTLGSLSWYLCRTFSLQLLAAVNLAGQCWASFNLLLESKD